MKYSSYRESYNSHWRFSPYQFSAFPQQVTCQENVKTNFSTAHPGQDIMAVKHLHASLHFTRKDARQHAKHVHERMHMLGNRKKKKEKVVL